MSIEENKTIIHHFVAARNDHDVAAFVAFFPAERQEHVRQAFNKVTEAFPNVQIMIEELITEGDRVVLRWSF
jgi:predicted ester cyclase